VNRPSATRWLILAIALSSLPARGDVDASEGAFRGVRDDVAAFRKDDSKRRYRHHYQTLVKRLRAVSDQHPRGAYSDDALYVAAQLLDEQHVVSRTGEDLEAAIAAYERVANAYPESNLADDALYAAALLCLEHKEDKGHAAKLLQRVVDMKAAADFRPQAKQLLATLPAPAPRDVGKVLEKLAAELAKELEIPHVEVLPDAPAAGAPAREVVAFEHSTTEDESVVTVRFEGEVGVRRGEVPPDGDKARRVFYDFKPARLPKRFSAPLEISDGVVARVRAGQFEPDVVRLVVELAADDEPSLSLTKDPFELKLSVSLAEQRGEPPVVTTVEAPLPPRAAPSAALATPAEVKARLGSSGAPGKVPLSQQLGLKVRRIVLDPGHGGKDTGALGKQGTKEKDVALAIAKLVRARLKKELPGLEVLMTREDDTFIELEDRTRFANDAGADLFISIHCNANPSRKVRGVETYYLNITHDRYAIRLAARENSHSNEDKRISDLQFILADLAMKSNVDESIRLGRQVQRSLVGRLREDYTGVQDLGLKHALFYVLLGARMPAILVETSFVSNLDEETRLRSKGYQDTVADGIVRGVHRFVEERHAMYAGD
jgi:N-acetylmuramoyl-L-alanine amidase